MNWLKRIFAALAVFIVCLVGWGVYAFLLGGQKTAGVPAPDSKIFSVGGKTFAVEVADEPAERQRGLSERRNLTDDQGMLFMFESLDTRNFWMAGMKFPLDIIWIQGDKVIAVSENLPPTEGSRTEIYSSPEPVDKVLEINAGLVQKLGIRIGDSIHLE